MNLTKKQLEYEATLEAKKSAIVAQQDKETVNLVQSTTNLT